MLNLDIVYSGVAALTITAVSGLIFIPMLRKFKFGQNVRDDGPKSHLKKSGTPTMGGIIIMTALIFTSMYFGLRYNGVYPVLFFTLACGLIGFIDDYIKVVQKRSLGFTALQKMLALTFVTVAFVLYIYNFTDTGSKILIPFVKGLEFDLGPIYIPIIVFIILGTINGANLTDGLDGLASGVTAIAGLFFAIVSIILGNIDMAVFSAMIAGTCLGFLIFNIYPAKVFMGDTGSLALGGAISAIAVALRMPLFIAIIGGIYLIEALSVIIQVVSYKTTGKRVFKMAPIHHHYELSGWRETKIVSVFWLMTGLLSIIGFVALK